MFKTDHALQHKLLKILIDKTLASKNEVVGLEERAISIDEIISQLGVKRERLSYITNDPKNDKHILTRKVNGVWFLYSGENIVDAYYSKKYLIQGRKRINDAIYDYTKWVLPVALIVVAVFTTCTNIQLSRDKSNTQDRIYKLEQEINNIKKLRGNPKPQS